MAEKSTSTKERDPKTGAVITSSNANNGRQREGLAQRLYSGDISFDFVRLRNRFYAISVVLMLVSVGALLIRGINPGIEFEGGAEFEISAPVNDQTVEDYTEAAQQADVPDLGEVTVRTIGDQRVKVQTRTLNPETEVPSVRQALAQQAGTTADEVGYSAIGASWGGQITQKALLALGIFLVLVTLMIAIYFRNWKMSVGAMVALLHDLVLTIGVYALVGFTVTPATVIGVLTILGYSLYDTVVVFDKVRENTRNLSGQTTRTYGEAANTAVNQVLIRSVNTTIVGVLPVAALLITGTFVLGEGPLKDLALALFVGMIAGAYSSIFIATPLLVQMKNRETDIRRHTARVMKRRGQQVDEADLAPVNKGKTKKPANRSGVGRSGVGADNDELARAEAEVNQLADENGGTRKSGRDTDRGELVDEDGDEAGEKPRIAVDTVRPMGVRSEAEARELRERGTGRPQPVKKPRSQRKK
ncbi:protein translocase subunit SecF [Propionibacteriaceae bacterium Y1685]